MLEFDIWSLQKDCKGRTDDWLYLCESIRKSWIWAVLLDAQLHGYWCTCGFHNVHASSISAFWIWYVLEAVGIYVTEIPLQAIWSGDLTSCIPGNVSHDGWFYLVKHLWVLEVICFFAATVAVFIILTVSFCCGLNIYLYLSSRAFSLS